MAILYRALNTVNGKSYIGYTSQTLEARRRAHEGSLSQCRVFASALSKYGTEAFIWSVIFEHHNHQLVLALEPLAIWTYSSLTSENGYNLTQGGDKTIFSKESKEKMSKSQLGRRHTADTIEKMKKDGRVGRKLSPEAKARGIAAFRNTYETTDLKLRLSIAQKKAWKRPEVRAKQSVSQKARFAQPEENWRNRFSQRTTTDAEEDEALRRLNSGESLNALCREFGWSSCKFYGAIKRAKLRKDRGCSSVILNP